MKNDVFIVDSEKNYNSTFFILTCVKSNQVPYQVRKLM